ncbi:hypothetical protein PAXINDRAFT_69100, partial [Paxillus involutus ATCC 200175]
VYYIVQMIPSQKVTSCGHIARPRRLMMYLIYVVVKHLGQTSSSVPWHRVISTSGIIAAHGDPGSVQRSALGDEGVFVRTGILGEPHVEFRRWRWFRGDMDVLSETVG